MAWAVKRLAADNAAAIGLADRGRLEVGLKADINVLDYDRLSLRRPEVVYDLPAGGKRLVQRTDGIDATVVSGAVVYREGEPTGAARSHTAVNAGSRIISLARRLPIAQGSVCSTPTSGRTPRFE